jgi:hypothetical protein
MSFGVSTFVIAFLKSADVAVSGVSFFAIRPMYSTDSDLDRSASFDFLFLRGFGEGIVAGCSVVASFDFFASRRVPFSDPYPWSDKSGLPPGSSTWSPAPPPPKKKKRKRTRIASGHHRRHHAIDA